MDVVTVIATGVEVERAAELVKMAMISSANGVSGDEDNGADVMKMTSAMALVTVILTPAALRKPKVCYLGLWSNVEAITGVGELGGALGVAGERK